MHAYNLFDDTLAATWGPGDVLGESMRMIGKAGRGVVVLIRRHRMAPVSEVLAASTRTMPDMEQSRLKEYGVGAQILIDLGVETMVLLTNTKGRRVVALEGYGLKIADTRPVVPGAHG
jgi:3,4-dihydroxy 2-butanone 4-phosphate synthase/GTP cyclohydrolase II